MFNWVYSVCMYIKESIIKLGSIGSRVFRSFSFSDFVDTFNGFKDYYSFKAVLIGFNP